MKQRLLWVLLAAALCLSALTGCEKTPEPVEFSTFAMNTFMSFTFYGGDEKENQRVQDRMNVTLRRLDSLLCVNNESGDVNQINRGAGRKTKVDKLTAAVSVPGVVPAHRRGAGHHRLSCCKGVGLYAGGAPGPRS